MYPSGQLLLVTTPLMDIEPCGIGTRVAHSLCARLEPGKIEKASIRMVIGFHTLATELIR